MPAVGSSALTALLVVLGFVALGAFFLGAGWLLISWGVPVIVTGAAAIAAMAGVFFGLQKWAGPPQ